MLQVGMSTHADAIRTTKRKLEEAFHTLDEAVGPSDSPDRPPPSKRIHTSPSLYSTLAKYGIKLGDTKLNANQSPYQSSSLSKSTPHLSAILSRAASQTKKSLSLRLGGHLPSPPLNNVEYRPSSISSFLLRLASYKLSTYANKPPAIDAVAAAKCGWLNEGKDRLVCGICKSSWVVAGRERMSREAGMEANTLIEKQRASLVQVHKGGCPWKSRQCNDSIYRIPLKPPAAMLKELKQNAIMLQALLEDIIVKHPLTSKQLHSFRRVVTSFSLSPSFELFDNEECSASRPGSPIPEDRSPSDNAILTSLFGWLIVPSAMLGTSSQRKSSSRASSVGPSITPRTSHSVHRETPLSTLASISMLLLNKTTLSRENALLYCPLCQRRIGLWAFAPAQEGSNGVTEGDSSPLDQARRGKTHPQRPFDLLKEHRSFCPYVVRSTPVPSLALTQANADARQGPFPAQMEGDEGNLEGWRAVLTTVLRYDMKQRVGYNILDDEAQSQDGDLNEPTEVDAVKAMVTGIKNRGGRDLLKYVRNLLG